MTSVDHNTFKFGDLIGSKLAQIPPGPIRDMLKIDIQKLAGIRLRFNKQKSPILTKYEYVFILQSLYNEKNFLIKIQ